LHGLIEAYFLKTPMERVFSRYLAGNALFMDELAYWRIGVLAYWGRAVLEQEGAIGRTEAELAQNWGRTEVRHAYALNRSCIRFRQYRFRQYQ
jgi:hypothetical protein